MLYNTRQREKKKIMANNFFVLHKEVVDVFNNKFYIPTIEKLSFHIAHVRIIGSMEFRKTKTYFLIKIYGNNIKLKRCHTEKPAKQLV